MKFAFDKLNGNVTVIHEGEPYFKAIEGKNHQPDFLIWPSTQDLEHVAASSVGSLNAGDLVYVETDPGEFWLHMVLA